MNDSPRVFCRHCGQAMNPADVFCSHCGQPRQLPASSVSPAAIRQIPVSAPATQAPGPGNPAAGSGRKPSGRMRLIAAGATILLVLLIIVMLAAALRPDPARLATGQSRLLISQTIAADGGQITVDANGALDGLVLEVSPNTYDNSQTFTIEAAEIENHAFGDLFTPASPLITIDNHQAIARIPLLLTIPIDLADDEFAMAFFYDEANGRLEAIPCVSQDRRSITLATRHFSSIVVSKVRKSLLEGRILEDDVQTDFKPGRNDFTAANDGSFAEQGGHCTGQVLAMIHYYNNNANDNYSGRFLRTESRVDNGLLPDTPAFWQDDALAFRFCSLLQRSMIWDSANQSEIGQQSEEIVFYSCAYAIALTNSPQILLIYGQDTQGKQVGHAVAVYGVSPAGLAVADPNLPGSLNQLVKRTYNTQSRQPMQLEDYLSAASTSDPGTLFTAFTYYGTYALFDFQAIDDLWQALLTGRDVAAGLFPADPAFLALSGRDDQGNPLTEPISQVKAISSGRAALANPADPAALLLTLPAADADMRLTFYRGTAMIGQPVDGLGQDAGNWFSCPLQPGENDIGILYERRCQDGTHRFVHFYRYQVYYGNLPSPTLTPTEASETDKLPQTPFAGRWEFSRFEVTGVSGGSQAFWQDIEFNRVTRQQWAYRYIGDFSDFLAHSSSYGEAVTFMSEIRIGLPVPPYSDAFEDRYFFQTNHVAYSEEYPELDGKRYRNRHVTIPAEMIGEQTLHAAGYDGTGGRDKNDMYLDLTVTLLDSKTAEGQGSITLNIESAGSITVSFDCAMIRTSSNARLEPEFDVP